MNIRSIIEKSNTWPKRQPATDEQIARCFKELCLNIPKEYEEFLLSSNGAEGFSPDSITPGYFILWSTDELPGLNLGYEVQTNFPGYLAIGSNGGGELLLLNTENNSSQPVLMIPAIEYDLQEAWSVGHNLADFLTKIGNVESTKQVEKKMVKESSSAT